jgi:hypothetical protein
MYNTTPTFFLASGTQDVVITVDDDNFLFHELHLGSIGILSCIGFVHAMVELVRMRDRIDDPTTGASMPCNCSSWAKLQVYGTIDTTCFSNSSSLVVIVIEV